MYLLLYSVTVVTVAKSTLAQQYASSTVQEQSISSPIANVNHHKYLNRHKEEKAAKTSIEITNENEDIYRYKKLRDARNIQPPNILFVNSNSSSLLPAFPTPTFPPPSLPLLPSSRIYSHPPSIRIIRGIPTTPLPKPFFDSSYPTNISAQLGMNAFLPCTIRNLNNNSISWIRSRDSHILTVDRYTFIADERFQAWHQRETETWTLQIKYVQERDAGRYECQVSTEPKMSHFVHFHVVTPLVHIPGGPDIYVKSGSTVTLKCIISGALILPEYIFWYKGPERVLADDVGGGREVLVEETSEDTTTGTLIITTASPKDQGSYTCVPATLPTAAVTLHVLNAGEHPAAMYHGGGLWNCSPPSPSLLLFCLTAGYISRERSSSTLSIFFIFNLLPR